MKKLLGIMLFGLFGIALSAGLVSAASSDCLNMRFNNGDSVCLGITKGNGKNFKLSVDKNNLSKGGSVRCYVILPNSSLYSFNNCEGVFSYAGTSTDDVIISATYIMRNGDFDSKRVGTELNFNKGVWGERNDTINSKGSSSSKSSSKSSNDLEITASPSSPDTYEWVKLKIETDDDYVGRIEFSKLQYRSSSSSSWSNISSTSSTYVSDYSTTWSNGYYRMTSSDDGEVTLNNLVKFKKSGYYRIYVEDTDRNEAYVQINVDTSSSSSSSKSSDDLEITASPSSPDTYEWVKLKIETDDDYVGRIEFTKLQYRSSSSSSWSNISSTSSTYVSDYSTTWSNGYYRMTSSDDGVVVLNNLVKFKKSGYYRIYVEDTDGNESYVQINVDTSSSSSSSSNDDLEITASSSSPDTYEWVKLKIETDDDYTGRIDFSKIQYRSSSSSSWTNISMTSSTYISDYSTTWSNGYYKMTSSDDGEVTLKNLVKFKKSGYYRIYLEDTDGNESYIQFSVGDVDDDDDDESKVSGFSTSEYSKVKSLYKDWDDTLGQLQRKYPSLKKDTYWQRLSDTLYNNMKDVVNGKSSRTFDDYDDFLKAFNSWYKYTMQNI